MKHKEAQNRFLIFLKDKRKKSIFKMFWEASYLWISKREIPFYYFKYQYRKSVTNFKDYLSTKEGVRIQQGKQLHNDELISIISNKLSFSLYCKKNGLPIAKMVSYNLDSNFFFEGAVFKVKNSEDLFTFFNHVFDKTTLQSIFIKPLAQYGGAGCFKINKNNLKEDIEHCSEYIIGTGYIHEELIQQHEDINKIHRNCINSIRLLTYIDKNKIVNIIIAYMRFGVGKSVVDNVSSGGFQVGLNLKTGILQEKGYQDMEFGGAEFYEHPTSGFIFKDFKIPYFKEVLDLTNKASNFLPDRIIGWDIAITPNGPVLIEANEYPSIYAADIVYGGLKKHPKIIELLSELKKK
ncbi:MAG: sugar-transfer associated ATP-grasp domain-containing protein [Flavobacteriaceae bacterium]